MFCTGLPTGLAELERAIWTVHRDVLQRIYVAFAESSVVQRVRVIFVSRPLVCNTFAGTCLFFPTTMVCPELS
jgi:hypothetical protein